MSILIRDAGVWKENSPSVRDGGIWKPVDTGFVRDAGVWKEFYSSGFDPGSPIGTFFEGGYYAGLIQQIDGIYAVFTAPKSAEAVLQWKTTNTSTPGTTSTADGLANSNAMNNAQHPAAKHCRDYRGGGHDDWYLPAKSELEIQYRAFKPGTTANNTSYGANPDSVPTTSYYTAGAPAQTSLAAFKTGGAEAFAANYYWSSTQGSAADAWRQIFSSGIQASITKANNYVVRPIRRIKIA